MQMIEPILDSCTAFQLCSTSKEPEGTKNKLLLACIRGGYHSGSMATIRWTPRQLHLADDLTKGNLDIAISLDKVLTSASHDHHSASYAVTSNVPATWDGNTTSHHAPSRYNGETPAATLRFTVEPLFISQKRPMRHVPWVRYILRSPTIHSHNRTKN